MSNRPSARLLDITRLVSRIGRGPLTGIDRIEAAYLDHLNTLPQPLYLLCRTPYGYLVLPGDAAEPLNRWLKAPHTLPPVDWFDRVRRRIGPKARAEAGLRALALARAPHWRLGRLLAKLLPMGGSYFNTGHANLTAQCLAQIKQIPDLLVAVMIHDTIPLDYPQYSSSAEPARFASKLEAALAYADLILCNSHSTRDDILRHAGSGRCPPLRVAYPGISLTAPEPNLSPLGLDLSMPFFVVLGTIEPRKNHAVLLDAWEQILRQTPIEKAPRLLVIGRRGWNNEAVFERLDTASFASSGVIELTNLPDGALWAILAKARGLLMPSFAEGFGLPMLEAAALKIPVLTAPTPAAQEIFGRSAVYLDPNDSYSWAEKILELTPQNAVSRGATVEISEKTIIPTWTDHFNLVLKDM